MKVGYATSSEGVVALAAGVAKSVIGIRSEERRVG